MVQTNSNLNKTARKGRLSWAEASSQAPKEKSNKQQRRVKRYNWL